MLRMRKFQVTMIMATAMIFMLAGCTDGNVASTVGTASTPTQAVVEATPTEAVTEVTPTEAVVEATPTEEVAAPTEAAVEASNLEWKITDFRDNGDVVKVGTLHDGEKFEAKEDDQFDTLIFSVKTEKVISGVEVTAEGDYFNYDPSERTNDHKVTVVLLHGDDISYDNYEAKTVITYDDGTTDEITIYITIPEGVYK